MLILIEDIEPEVLSGVPLLDVLWVITSLTHFLNHQLLSIKMLVFFVHSIFHML